MIGVVVVSHSPQLARAAVELALEMIRGDGPAVAIAAGVYDGSTGTDATRIAEAIGEVASPDGVLVVVDLGSAVLSAELALELIDLPGVEVRVTSAPFVEGLMAGLVLAAAGASLDEVEREARESLESKRGQLGDPAEAPAPVPESGELTLDLRLRNPSGLHIRPASMIVLALTPLAATVTLANLRTGSGPRLANSPTKLLTLAAQKGDVVRVSASGDEARAALDVVRRLVADGFGELDEPAASVPAGGPTRGGPLGVSPGRAVGPVVRMPEPLAAPVQTAPLPRAERAAAAASIVAACDAVAASLRGRAERVTGDSRAILEAAALLAVDPETLSDARAAVIRRGDTAEYAVWTTYGDLAEGFRLQGGRMAERAADFSDMRNRIVAELRGRPAPGVPVRTEPFVLVARDLAPADTALLDPAVCVAIVTLEGGPTSHTAILSRSLGLPALVSVENALELEEGTVVLVDGTAGTLTVNPSEEQIAEVTAQANLGVEFGGLGATADGHRVHLLANVGSPASVEAALAASAEGIGLFRTEFLFLGRAEAPSVEEQAAAYGAVFSSFAGRRVIIRTLDAGADKPLAFVTLPHEANPALGIRGYRTSWRRPELIDEPVARHRHGGGSALGQGRGHGAHDRHPRRGGRLRRAVRRARADHGRRDDRDARGGRDGGGDLRARRLREPRDQRPRPVHDGGRSRGRRTRAAQRPVAAGGAADDAARVRRGCGGGQARERVRRGGGGPHAGRRAGRARGIQPVDVAPRARPRERTARGGSRSRSAAPRRRRPRVREPARPRGPRPPGRCASGAEAAREGTRRRTESVASAPSPGC